MDPTHLSPQALRERPRRCVLRPLRRAVCGTRNGPAGRKPTDRPVDTSWMGVLYCAVSRRCRPSLARVPGW